MWGLGASAHLTLQVARHQGARTHVFTRAPAARELALRLGADSAQGVTDPTPEPLDSAILFAPVGDLVPWALAALDRGGTLAVAGVHLTDVPPLVYEDHLFEERSLTSVTANTRGDGAALLALAEEVPLRPEVTTYPFDAVDTALDDLAADRVGRDGGGLAQAVRRARSSASRPSTSAAARGEATWNAAPVGVGPMLMARSSWPSTAKASSSVTSSPR